MGTLPAGAALSAAGGSAWSRWSWRWLLVELGAVGVLLGVSSAPAARVPPLVPGVALGAGAAAVLGGLVLGFGVSLYARPLASGRRGRSDAVAWADLSLARRRELTRLLRRGLGDRVAPEDRSVAVWCAARSLTTGVPLATGQTGLAVLWTAMSVTDPPGGGMWWLHVVFGLLFGSVGVLAAWWAPGFRRSLARMHAADDGTPHDDAGGAAGRGAA